MASQVLRWSHESIAKAKQLLFVATAVSIIYACSMGLGVRDANLSEPELANSLHVRGTWASGYTA